MFSSFVDDAAQILSNSILNEDWYRTLWQILNSFCAKLLDFLNSPSLDVSYKPPHLQPITHFTNLTSFINKYLSNLTHDPYSLFSRFGWGEQKYGSYTTIQTLILSLLTSHL